MTLLSKRSTSPTWTWEHFCCKCLRRSVRRLSSSVISEERKLDCVRGVRWELCKVCLCSRRTSWLHGKKIIRSNQSRCCGLFWWHRSFKSGSPVGTCSVVYSLTISFQLDAWIKQTCVQVFGVVWKLEVCRGVKYVAAQSIWIASVLPCV